MPDVRARIRRRKAASIRQRPLTTTWYWGGQPGLIAQGFMHRGISTAFFNQLHLKNALFISISSKYVV